MKGIRTHYLGQTNKRPPRIVARTSRPTDGFRVVIASPSSEQWEDDHRIAREKLLEQMEYYPKDGVMGRWVMGTMPDGSVAHVFAKFPW